MTELIIPSRGSIVMYLIIILYLIIDFDYVVGENSTNYSMESKRLLSRRKNGRYLVYPTPGTLAATKVQLIVGLGLPMEVDVSMIVGYVMKFNYVLPYNASYLTHPDTIRYDRSIDPRSILGCRAKKEEEEKRREENEGKKEEEGRRDGIARSVSKSTTVESTEIPLEVRAEESGSGSTSRWEMYRVIESVLDTFQVSGKGCLLKAVCQVAEVPFENSHAGLVAQLIHVLLTPSMTWEKNESNGDQEYRSAEVAGRENPGKCESLFPECGYNLLEYFTEIKDFEEQVKSPGFSY